ncbi:hypothetical protein SS50377_24021 [Spironucleus salmonicida]|uniref:Uncharacterized protein n=1 Tax=Spironucleus salmonicida TaxID=348837 RepID=V6M1J2_9EUKA|nr:hypothetical protein SS50377_24014 [Spironucleus salmonicida]KAH0574079.1 hypothetical protein SS50377_24021 [Spironucleus salmonicida]|eukprot:EST47059.1 Hypothetical protein SS50377_12865 [Spironucleus salmonicida]
MLPLLACLTGTTSVSSLSIFIEIDVKNCNYVQNEAFTISIPLQADVFLDQLVPLSNKISTILICQDPTCFAFLSSGNDIYVEVNQPSGFYGNLLIPVSAESKHDLTSPVFIIIWLVLASLSVLAVVLGGVYYCRGFRRVRKNGYNIIVQ